MSTTRARPGDPSYSGRGAIAKSLRSLTEIEAELGRAEASAQDAHKARSSAADRSSKAAVQAAEDVGRRTESDTAQLIGELDKIARDSANVLHQVGLSPSQAAGASSRPRRAAAGGINATIDEINAAIADLRSAVEELERVRLTAIVRFRRKIGLPP